MSGSKRQTSDARRGGTAAGGRGPEVGRQLTGAARGTDELPEAGGLGSLSTDELRSRAQVARAVIAGRLERGLSQQQLAERVGTTQARISQIEGMTGNVRFDTLERVAHALDLTVVLASADARSSSADNAIAGTPVSAGTPAPVGPGPVSGYSAAAAIEQLLAGLPAAHGAYAPSISRVDLPAFVDAAEAEWVGGGHERLAASPQPNGPRYIAGAVKAA